MEYETLDDVDGVEIRIYRDDVAGNPYQEWDTLSSLLAVPDRPIHRDYRLDAETISALGDLPTSALQARYLTLFGGYAVAIPYVIEDYGSNGLRGWLTTPDDAPVDGFVVVARKALAEEGVDRETAERCAHQEWSTFGHWLEGDVFGYVIDPDGPDEDSCWGYYGFADVREAALEAARYAADQKQERAALAATFYLCGGMA